MNQMLKRSMLAAVCSSALFLTACGSGDDDWNIWTSNTKSYAVDDDVSALAAKHEILTYEMQSVASKEINATTLVFIPKGAAPADGWPVVVWAHGTTGAADKCAPSNNVLDGPEKDLVKALLAKGYAVVAPDYEGLGNTSVPHPYLNLTSAATSILSAVKAANEQYGNLSKKWSVIGWSQGGHAALAASQFQKALLGYNFKGAVAIAPASYLADTLDEDLSTAQTKAAAALTAGDSAAFTQAVGIAATAYTYAAIVSSGIKAETPSFQYVQSFLPAKVPIAEQAETLCSPELGLKFGADIQQYMNMDYSKFFTYKALQPNFLSDPDIKNYLKDNTPGTVKLDKPVVIYQGTADTTVPVGITKDLDANMTALGTDVRLEELGGETHSTAFANNINALVGEINTLMTAN
ncbi:alpha/beta fold hydrolase [Acinetobacter sp.]|uniref:alpha/beta hydrolase n=1 Tax=Acinetobacter sp. TaxID=472 RepID=UPI0035B15297